MIHGERCAHRKPRVSGGGLDVHTLKGRVVKNFAVRHAVEGYAAGET